MKNFLLVFVLVFTSLVFAIEPQTPPGSGTQKNPYEISKCEHLLWIGNPANEDKVYAILTDDIDCIAITNLVLEDNLKFYGSLDGQGHTLFNTVGYFHYHDEENDEYYYDGLFDFYGELKNVNIRGNCYDPEEEEYLYCCFADAFEGTVDNIKLFNSDFANYIKSSSVSNTRVFYGYLAYYSISDSSIQMVQVNSGTLVYEEGTYNCTIQNVELNEGALTPYDSGSFIENIIANNFQYLLIERAEGTVLSKAQISGYFYPFYHYNLQDMGGCICNASSCVISNVAVNANLYAHGVYWENVGGIIGSDEDSSSRIINSYFGGYIANCTNNVGGLVGYGKTSAESCYFVSNDDYNNNVGTGVDYYDLYYQSTFKGWDFDNVWTMGGWSKPQLRLKLCFSENKPQIPPGKGTEDEPYEISQYEHLLWLRGQDNSWIYAVLTADIDASASSADLFVSCPYFSGNIDGQGHTIYNLIGNYFDGEEYIDGYLNFDEGSIYNLNFIWNKTNGVFASYFSGRAENISVTNGRFANTIDDGSLKKFSITNGSLANYIDWGLIENVNINYGYLASECEEGMIQNVEINGGYLADGFYDSTAQIIKINNGFLASDAYSSRINFVTIDGEINSSDPRFSEFECIGGCVFYSENSVIANAAVNVNITRVEGSDDEWENMGGIVGYDDDCSLIYDSYFIGQIEGTTEYGVGGIVGTDQGDTQVVNCYFDAVKAPTNGFGNAVSDADLKKKATFEDWDFDRVWTIDEGKSYPQFRERTHSQTPPGSGIKGDPYQISKFEHLLWLGENSNYDYDEEKFDNYFYAVLTADIYAGTLWASPGGEGEYSDLCFGGRLDGQGHTIYDLNAYSLCFDDYGDVWYWEDSYSGFFNCLGGDLCNINFIGKNTRCRIADELYDSTVENIKINNGCLGYWGLYGIQADNIEITDGFLAVTLNGSTVRNIKINNGLLAFRAGYSHLDRVSIDGKISSSDLEWEYRFAFGGCIDEASDCTISNVAVNVDITKDETNDYYRAMGGLVGSTYGNLIIVNSYYAGKITGTSERGCGGIVGATNGYVSVVSSYFDKAKAPANGFGKGVSNAELKQKATFKDWDFVNIWDIDEGKGMPYLIFEIPEPFGAFMFLLMALLLTRKSRSV